MILLDLTVSDERPIYSRISDRVKFAVAAGVVRPGELIPSVREMSKQLLVNPNTVARAYRELQTEGLVEPVRGTGLQVAEGAPERCRGARHAHIRSRLRSTIDEALQSGMERGEVESIVREECARVGLAADRPNVFTERDGGGNA
jgi:GntR family transcriptional regulator